MSGVLTLALEAATSTGSAAVLRDDELLATREVAMRGGAEEHLLPAIDAALGEAGITSRDLGRIVCGAGPGASRAFASPHRWQRGSRSHIRYRSSRSRRSR